MSEKSSVPHPSLPEKWTITERQGHAVYGRRAIECLLRSGDGNAFALVTLGGPGAISANPEDVRALASYIVLSATAHPELTAEVKRLREIIQDLLPLAQSCEPNPAHYECEDDPSGDLCGSPACDDHGCIRMKLKAAKEEAAK